MSPIVVLILRVLAIIVFVVVALSKLLEIDNVVLYPVQWVALGLALWLLSVLTWPVAPARRRQ